MMTQGLYAALNKRLSPFQKLHLTVEALEEVNFWLNSSEEFYGHDIWPKPSVIRAVYSDAGFGSYTVEQKET